MTRTRVCIVVIATVPRTPCHDILKGVSYLPSDFDVFYAFISDVLFFQRNVYWSGIIYIYGHKAIYISRMWYIPLVLWLWYARYFIRFWAKLSVVWFYDILISKYPRFRPPFSVNKLSVTLMSIACWDACTAAQRRGRSAPSPTDNCPAILHNPLHNFKLLFKALSRVLVANLSDSLSLLPREALQWMTG